MAALALTGAAIAAMTLIVLGVLRWRLRTPGGAALPLPTAGIVPLHAGGGAVAVVMLLPALGIRSLPASIFHATREFDRLESVRSRSSSRPLCGRGCSRGPTGVAPSCAESRTPISGEAWLRAIVLSVAALLALYAISAASFTSHGLAWLVDPISIAIAAAVIADLVAEWRDRRRASSWPCGRCTIRCSSSRVRDRLVAAGIPHHIQSTRFRTLLWLLGPYVPMTVLVPTEHAEAAYALLSSP